MMDELFETGTAAVLMHGVMNDLGVIAAVREVLDERWHELSATRRQELLGTIDESATRGLERLRLLVHADLAGNGA